MPVDWVLDASAVLALVNGERGGEEVLRLVTPDTVIPSVNLVEAISRLVGLGMSTEVAAAAAQLRQTTVFGLQLEIAAAAGGRHAALRLRGFSLADVICLETARALGATAVTADRSWAELPDQVRIIR